MMQCRSKDWHLLSSCLKKSLPSTTQSCISNTSACRLFCLNHEIRTGLDSNSGFLLPPSTNIELNSKVIKYTYLPSRLQLLRIVTQSDELTIIMKTRAEFTGDGRSSMSLPMVAMIKGAGRYLPSFLYSKVAFYCAHSLTVVLLLSRGGCPRAVYFMF